MKFSSVVFVIFAIAVFLSITLALPARLRSAEVYKWVDENGTIWFTDHPENLPQESQGQYENVTAPKKPPESSPGKGARRGSAPGSDTGFSAASYLRRRNRQLEERKKLLQEISTIEQNLAAGRRALRRVPLTDRRGYWFVIDPASGKKVPATYKDPGAIWSTQTWSAVPRSARTKESEERRRIQSEIEKFEKDLKEAKEKLSALSTSF